MAPVVAARQALDALERDLVQTAPSYAGQAPRTVPAGRPGPV
ncbi:hypothetical protein [Streptomyces gibsoniae]|uniref:Uncharacterized protein n=1 Tax=Streptomyces gibsoniae TaxID=3075529 RepID=A0ABU2TVE4_9ACTN|nr:hypothetical protein [Streptomyces sp. DSM 41699]MDT0464939.1 hypothetical protein [Streptomyces sp. DSM 41699]